MKNRIDNLKKLRTELEDDITHYITNYCKLEPTDLISYEPNYNYLTLNIVGVGTVSIWSNATITNLSITPICELDKPQTVEEFIAMRDRAVERAKVIPRAFLAFKYIINHDWLYNHTYTRHTNTSS